ncbi:hypothetical protein ACFPFX_35355 [Streptomyces mauvecolor]|uniref:Gliding motility protein n=1 Tax=Streptomyces mauvecolor TaxID=58345 RepID=A0ABV9UYR3_9ACTN
MGVFSRFRRKADVAVAESTEEVKAATPTAEPEAEGDTGTSADRPAAEASEVSEAAEETEAAESAESGAAEGVEIPKQQSAEEAADSEAGESARK